MPFNTDGLHYLEQALVEAIDNRDSDDAVKLISQILNAIHEPKPSLNRLNADRKSFLSMAAEKDLPMVIEALVRFTPNKDVLFQADNENKLPLHFAVISDSSNAMNALNEFILKNTSDANKVFTTVDKDGNTALHYAMLNFLHPSSVYPVLAGKLLKDYLKTNTRLDLHNNIGDSAIDLFLELEERKQKEIFRLLDKESRAKFLVCIRQYLFDNPQSKYAIKLNSYKNQIMQNLNSMEGAEPPALYLKKLKKHNLIHYNLIKTEEDPLDKERVALAEMILNIDNRLQDLRGRPTHHLVYPFPKKDLIQALVCLGIIIAEGVFIGLASSGKDNDLKIGFKVTAYIMGFFAIGAFFWGVGSVKDFKEKYNNPIQEENQVPEDEYQQFFNEFNEVVEKLESIDARDKEVKAHDENASAELPVSSEELSEMKSFTSAVRNNLITEVISSLQKVIDYTENLQKNLNSGRKLLGLFSHANESVIDMPEQNISDDYDSDSETKPLLESQNNRAQIF